MKLSDRALNRYRRTQVGFVWQQVARNLIVYLSAGENVELPMTIAGLGLREKRARSRELLEAVGLWGERHRSLTQLSGGQQQRIAIAVALASRPRLLLADEPTGEVDSATARSLFDLFRALNRAYGLTTIVVTHDPGVARQVDRVVAIRDGKTSTETIRQGGPEDRVTVGAAPVAPGTAGHAAPEAYHEYVVLDSAGRLQVPKEYLERLGIADRATLEVTGEGVLIRPVAGREVPTRPPSAGTGDGEPGPRRRWGLRAWWPFRRER